MFSAEQARRQPEDSYHSAQQANISDVKLSVTGHDIENPQVTSDDLDCEMTDAGFSEIDDDGEDDDSGDEDSWSGEVDNLEVEAVVLRTLGRDLSLAAYLIPLLYKSIHVERTTTSTQKVVPWRNDLVGCAAGANTEQESPLNLQNTSTSHPSKKRRRNSDKQNRAADENGEGDDDDENGDPHDLENSPETDGGGPILRLACPFHKINPYKYSIQHEVSEGSRKTDYRSCAGPGYTSIQRLKLVYQTNFNRVNLIL